MKKFLVVAIIVLSVFALAACGGSPTSSDGNQQAQQGQQEPEDTSAGNLGDYHVVIKDAEVTQDFEGKTALKVTYDFTNNSEENASFMWAINDLAFQNGVQIESTVLSGDETDWTNIKPEATLEVHKAYILSDTTKPVDIELTGAFSFDDTKITKTFDLTNL